MRLDGSYMELGKPTYLAGRNGESKLARFHVPCYHFFRLSCLLNQPVPYYQLLFNHFLLFGRLLNQPVPYYQLLFNHFFVVWKTILNKMLKLGFWHFQPIFLRMQFLSLAIITLKFWFKRVPCRLSIFHLRFENKMVRVLGLHIWNQLLKTLKGKWSF